MRTKTILAWLFFLAFGTAGTVSIDPKLGNNFIEGSTNYLIGDFNKILGN
jgi:hypothetical protein